MNQLRYEAYRRAIRNLETEPLTTEERRLLRDGAEGLLLARSADEEELGELTLGISIVIDSVVSSQRLDAEEAAELRAELAQCGPSGALVAT